MLNFFYDVPNVKRTSIEAVVSGRSRTASPPAWADLTCSLPSSPCTRAQIRRLSMPSRPCRKTMSSFNDAPRALFAAVAGPFVENGIIERHDQRLMFAPDVNLHPRPERIKFCTVRSWALRVAVRELHRREVRRPYADD